MLARIAMIAITTNNSMRVNPRSRREKEADGSIRMLELSAVPDIRPVAEAATTGKPNLLWLERMMF